MMKKSIIRIFALIILGVLGQGVLAQAPNKKALLIIVDGIPTNIIHRAHTPNLDRIESKGRFLESYVGGERGGASETPTISSNGYAATVTGTWAHKNNVYDNSLNAVNYNYPSIFRLFKDAYPEGKTAIFSTWLDNRTKLLGEGRKETRELMLDHHVDGLELDTIQYPHDNLSNYIKRIDAHVALEAAKYIAESAPDLTWVYLQYTDDVSHYFGRSFEFDNGITYTDALVGLIYDAVLQREKEHGEEWLVIVITDHGRTPFTAKHHGGQSEAERNTWMVINQKEVNNYARDFKVANTDVTPTIAEYLGIELPTKVTNEMDGVSLLSPIDAVNLRAKLLGKKELFISWDPIDLKSTQTAEIYVSYTNNYSKGGEDSYQNVGKVNLKDGYSSIKLPKQVNGFVKVLLKTPNHTLNSWVKLNK